MHFKRQERPPAKYRSSVPSMRSPLFSERIHSQTVGAYAVFFGMQSSNPVRTLNPVNLSEASESFRLLEMKSHLNTYYPNQCCIDNWQSSKQRITPKETKRMDEHIEMYIGNLKESHQYRETDDASRNEPKIPRDGYPVFSIRAHTISRNRPL